MGASLFDEISARIGDGTAIFLEEPSGARHTYGDMLAWSARYARALATLGVRHGDRVAVQTGKHVACVWTYLACLRMGAVYLPLNSAYVPAEVGRFVAEVEPRVLVCEPDAVERLGAATAGSATRIETLAGNGCGSLELAAAAASDAFPQVAVTGDDLAAILFTSGTTGRSKGAMITHENLRSNALALVETWRFTAQDVLLHALPIFHAHGLFVAINVTLLAGGSLLFQPRFEVEAVLAALPRATAMMGVPTYYARLLAHPGLTRDAVRHVRVFISGSAPLPAEAHRAFAARTGHAILERYGMTETVMITSNPYDGERRPGTVGFPLPGVTCRIADPATGRELPQGEVGVIEVKGPNVFKGYWGLPEKTAEEFRPDGFFITGDLGLVDEHGYYRIVGRAKDLVISGGLNVYPAEVEAALDTLPEIAEAAVIGVPHDDLGEAVVAVCVPRPGAVLDEVAVRRGLEPLLARFKLPKRVIAVDELPRNAMGKVQKAELRQRHAGLFRPHA